MNPELILASFQKDLAAKFGRDIPAHLMSLSPASVHIDRALTNLAVAYANREYVADKFSPIVRVEKKSDTYFEWNVNNMLQVANTTISGQRGRPGEVAYSLSSANNFSVTDRGLMDFVATDEEENADPPLAIRQTATEIVTNFLLLARELRIATVASTSGNYGSSTTPLAGARQWNNYGTSTPVTDILTARRTPLLRPNTMFMDEITMDVLRAHPQMLQFITGRAQAGGASTSLMIDEKTIASMFRIDEVVVAAAKYVSTAEGLAVTQSYVWPKMCALTRVQSQPDRRRTENFHYSFRYGTMQTQAIPDLINGVRGGTWIKVTHSDAEKLIAGGNAGYLIETPIA